MSYGIWKKRGKDWSSFEIDGCDDWRWERMPEWKQKMLQKKAADLGLHRARWEDPNFVVWFIGQHDRCRTVREVATNSCHALWIGFRNEAALQAALTANGYRNLEGERIYETA
jgi:hypothetical protein